MNKLEQLTPEQEALIPVVRDEWIHTALLAGDDLDINAAKAGIEWMYSQTKLKKPMIIVVDSPLAAQYAANIITIETGQRDQVRDQVWGQVWGQVRDQVRAQVRIQVGDQVRIQVRIQVEEQVWDQVRAQVRIQVRAQVWDQVWDQVEGQVEGQVRAEKLKTFDWAYDSLGWRSGDFSYLDFFYKIGITQHEGLKKYLDYLRSGVFFAIFLDGCAIISRRPNFISRDASHALDSDNKAAIEWRDGYKLYYLHGVAFTEEQWQKIVNQQMTLEDIGKDGLSADQNAVAIQMLKPDLLLKQVNAKLIHTGISGTRLYQVDNFQQKVMGQKTNNDRTEYCMLMKHPSLEKEYIEWVEPSVGKQGNADEAQAAAFGVPLEDYLLAIKA